MTDDALKREIKDLIIEVAHLSDVSPADISDDGSLFESKLFELDSVDVLEITVALHNKYGVRVDDRNLARNVLVSVDTIAEFVAANRTKPA